MSQELLKKSNGCWKKRCGRSSAGTRVILRSFRLKRHFKSKVLGKCSNCPSASLTFESVVGRK